MWPCHKVNKITFLLLLILSVRDFLSVSPLFCDSRGYMEFKVYWGLLHLLYESPWYTCQGDFVVVSFISLKQISLHRSLAVGLWVAENGLFRKSDKMLASLAFYLFSPTCLINSMKHEHSYKILCI